MQLINGDCLEEMKAIPDKSVDMILCDLPFGTTQNRWDIVIPFEPLWTQYNRIIKDNGAVVLFAQQPFTTDIISSNRKRYKYCWYWDKHLKTNFLNAKRQPLRQVEEIVVFYKKQPHFSPPVLRTGRHTVCLGKGQSKNYGAQPNRDLNEKVKDTYSATTLLTDFPKIVSANAHPTQKPVNLLEYLIKTYTVEGNTVLDNCMGSGSTGVACINTDRNFIGIEKDKHYFESAAKRIEQAFLLHGGDSE